MYTSFRTHEEPLKSFDDSLRELRDMMKKGFNGFLFRSVGSMFEQNYINISIDREYDTHSLEHCRLEKRYVDSLYNNESNLVVGDFLANYDMEIYVNLYGHPHHSIYGDSKDEAMYIPEIEIDPRIVSSHYDAEESIYSTIPWEDFKVGNYPVMLRDKKNGCNSFGGILKVWYNESGEKCGYISNDKDGVL